MSAKKSKQVQQKELQAYLDEARSWEASKAAEAERSRRLAWRVAGASMLISLVAVAGISALGPLKEVVPYVIRVDNTTGIVDIVTAMKDGQTNYDEAMNKFFVQRYVRYRESYSKELAPNYYRNVGLMSAPAEQQRYHAFFNPKNPGSPLNVYSDYAKVKVNIKSTSFITPNVALVRYIKEVERGNEKDVSHWAATVTFSYVKAPISEQDREVNPLGFVVTEYRNDPEGAAYESAPTAQQPSASPKQQESEPVTIYPGQAQTGSSEQ